MPTLSLPTPGGFDLPRTACSYGYFLLAPNFWDPRERTLARPLRLRDGSPVNAVIRQARSASGGLRVELDAPARGAERTFVLGQVRRMLRLDEDAGPWRRALRRVDPQLAEVAADRMFRSPTLFEDLIKTVTSCNVNWPNTRTMNRQLCLSFGGGAFPLPGQLAAAGEADIKELGRVGYRAGRIRELSRRVAGGELDLDALDDPTRPTQELYEAFRALPGLGPYAAGNLCHLVGRYDRLAIDTETRRHFCLHHRAQRPASTDAAGNRALDARIAAHYAAAGPFAFKHFWSEMWADFEVRFGPAWSWDRATTGASFTASVLKETNAVFGD